MTEADKTARIALEALYSVIDELNLDLSEDARLEKRPETRLFGGEGGLESIDLVRLIVLYETEIADRTGCSVSISDDRAMSDTHSHFGTIGALAGYATELIRQEGGLA